jgi:hypothetical protein
MGFRRTMIEMTRELDDPEISAEQNTKLKPEELK